MDVSFQSRKLAKQFNESANLDRIHGTVRAKLIRIRLSAMRAAESLHDFWPPKSPPQRCHELTRGRRAGTLSVDLDHPYRLIFRPAEEPVPVKEDGGLDWARVTAVVIIGIEDTHE